MDLNYKLVVVVVATHQTYIVVQAAYGQQFEAVLRLSELQTFDS
jgi:hypothetical protein